ncbi:MAG: metal ABC transporter permease [Spirochaetes bacterium]|nr:metal ABC transporter permease [Spirochaetota bacterium]
MPDLFLYPFFLRAVAAAVLASLCCGIIGTYIVSRRMVFMSGGISHASFGGIGMAYYFGFDPIIGAAVFSVACAAAIDGISRRAGMRADSLIGILWSLGMAVGIIFVYITPGYAPDLMSYLFGSILTVTGFHLALMAAVATLTVLLFAVFYRDILYIAFDEEFSLTRGLPVHAVSFMMLGLAALVIVVSIKVVGIILVLSLLTVPQATAGLLARDFRGIMILSVLLGLASSLSGLLISYFLNIPSGATIIFTSVVFFAAVSALRTISVRLSLRNRVG